MNRTSTIKTAALALALASAASVATAQYRANAAVARADSGHEAKAIARDSRASTPAVVAQEARGPGNFYIGLAAGASMPSGNFADNYRSGWSATVPVGWRPRNGPLGLRLDLAYSKWGGENIGGVTLPSAAVWDGMLDATVDMPFGARRTSSFYLVGGGGAHYFPDYGGSQAYQLPGAGDTTTTTPGPTGPGGYQVNAVAAIGDRSSTTRFGLNGGAGLSFAVAPGSSLFFETRYITVFTKNERTNYWPLVGGLRWSMR